jgi:hypothetical protein
VKLKHGRSVETPRDGDVRIEYHFGNTISPVIEGEEAQVQKNIKKRHARSISCSKTCLVV